MSDDLDDPIASINLPPRSYCVRRVVGHGSLVFVTAAAQILNFATPKPPAWTTVLAVGLAVLTLRDLYYTVMHLWALHLHRHRDEGPDQPAPSPRGER